MDDALLLQKYHGLGNDYLVLDPNKNKIHLLERHIVKLCRRISDTDRLAFIPRQAK